MHNSITIKRIRGPNIMCSYNFWHDYNFEFVIPAWSVGTLHISPVIWCLISLVIVLHPSPQPPFAFVSSRGSSELICYPRRQRGASVTYTYTVSAVFWWGLHGRVNGNWATVMPWKGLVLNDVNQVTSPFPPIFFPGGNKEVAMQRSALSLVWKPNTPAILKAVADKKKTTKGAFLSDVRFISVSSPSLILVREGKVQKMAYQCCPA